MVQEIARGWRITKGIEKGVTGWGPLFQRSDFFWRFEVYVQVFSTHSIVAGGRAVENRGSEGRGGGRFFAFLFSHLAIDIVLLRLVFVRVRAKPCERETEAPM